ncbi:MAG TPA: hypothetical protein VGI43_19850 [Mucilaginibacter sp.]|jgi:hypothetical protein
MLRISITVLFIFICGLFSFSYAQDTTKPNPEQIQKPVSRYKSYRTRTAKTDSEALKAGAQQIVPAAADTSEPAPAEDKSLKGQYLFLLTKVYHYQQPFVYSFWKNTSDTLKLYRQVQKAANSKLILQNKIIDSLKTQMSGKDEALSSKVEEISFFGLQMSLTLYNIIVWGLMIGFALIAIIVISSSSSYRSEAKYRSNLYSDLEDEFKTFKTKANEREKKLARELQTERNKLDELMGGDENDAV